jgi:hypothetical protein
MENENPFTKEEWFIFMYLTKRSIEKNINFNNIIDNINISDLLNEIKFNNEF